MSDEDDDLHEEAVKKIKSLIRDFPSVERDADIKETLQKLAGQLEASDKLYPILKQKLVGSGFDSKHIKKLLQLSASTAKRINSSAKNFNVREKALKLKRIHKNDFARHIAMGYAAGDFRYAPTFEFFYGAIPLEGLVLKPRKKRARIDMAPQNATQTKATERDIELDVEQDSTPKEVEAIYKKVKNLTTRDPEPDFLSAIVDPESFARTVENIFHFSFLVREGRVGLAKGRSNKSVVKVCEDDAPNQWNQSILSFSLKDYEKWVEKYG